MTDATVLPPLCEKLSMTLHSQINEESLPPPSVVCIEIKPKCGFITSCRTVRPEDAHLKHSTSRYCLHQILKLQEGDINTTSEYDPVDLFSGNRERVEKALIALFNHPQNNLVLFVDGERINLENFDTSLATAASALSGDDFLNHKDYKQLIARVLAAIFEQESVLANIAAAQQACHYDIEGVYRMYCQLLDLDSSAHTSKLDNGSPQNCVLVERLQGDPDNAAHLGAIQELLALPRAEALAVLRSYVISATAKDCSIMVTMRKESFIFESRPQSNAEDNLLTFDTCGMLACSDSMQVPSVYNIPTEQTIVKSTISGRDDIQLSPWGIRYKVTVVDLDRKALSKIPKHFELDREIMAAAKLHYREQE